MAEREFVQITTMAPCVAAATLLEQDTVNYSTTT